MELIEALDQQHRRQVAYRPKRAHNCWRTGLEKPGRWSEAFVRTARNDGICLDRRAIALRERCCPPDLLQYPLGTNSSRFDIGDIDELRITNLHRSQLFPKGFCDRLQ